MMFHELGKELLKPETLDGINATVDESLKHPELAAQSEEFKAGYRRGFVECSAALALFFERKSKEQP